MSRVFHKYPQLQALENRDLFMQGKLLGHYGIVWNEELDFETESIYEEGEHVRNELIPLHLQVANEIVTIRKSIGMSQSQLAMISGIDQSDISKIERGVANPSLQTIDRLLQAMNCKGKFTIE